MTLEELANEVDKFAHDYDPYEYEDNGWSYEKTLEQLVNDPKGVLKWMTEAFEELVDDFCPIDEEVDEADRLRIEIARLVHE